MLYRKIIYQPISTTSGHNQDSVKTKLKGIALSGYRSSPNNSVFSKNEYQILRRLQSDNTIAILKPDKGNGVAILNKTDYISKMTSILQDASKFTPLHEPIKITMNRVKTKCASFLKT